MFVIEFPRFCKYILYIYTIFKTCGFCSLTCKSFSCKTIICFCLSRRKTLGIMNLRKYQITTIRFQGKTQTVGWIRTDKIWGNRPSSNFTSSKVQITSSKVEWLGQFMLCYVRFRHAIQVLYGLGQVGLGFRRSDQV